MAEIVGEFRVQGEAELIREVRLEISREIAGVIQQSIPSIEENARILIRGELDADSAVISIRRGVLHSELGLATPDVFIDAVIAETVAHIRAIAIPADSERLGGIRITLFSREVLDALYALPVATYQSINRIGNSTLIPWLRWLLADGEDIVVVDYLILTKGFFAGTRTGQSAMVKPKERARAGWRVPEHTGREENNFLTRALEKIAPRLLSVMLEELSRRGI